MCVRTPEGSWLIYSGPFKDNQPAGIRPKASKTCKIRF
jgi:hypothetical protein